VTKNNGDLNDVRRKGFLRGACAKNGKLYVFSSRRVIVIRGWPHMEAWTKTIARPGWVRIRPHIDLAFGYVNDARSKHRFKFNCIRRDVPALEDDQGPLEEDQNSMENACDDPWRNFIDKSEEASEIEKRIFRGYFANIPGEIFSRVVYYLNRHWHMLAMLARCKGAADLMYQAPALAYALASPWVFNGTKSGEAMRHIRKVVNRRRRVICSFLGFDESGAAVSVFKKIQARACSIPGLLTLRDLLRDEQWRNTLGHLTSINLETMMILANPSFRRSVSPSFLRELSEAPPRDHDELRTLFLDLFHMRKNLGYPADGNAEFRSVRHLVRHHDRLVDLVNRKELANLKKYSFPKAPLPGTKDIIPLDTPELLFEEARVQHNCVMSYAKRIVQGQIHFYRLFQPERATVAIVQDTKAGWRIQEIAGPFNARVKGETLVTVHDWIAQQAGR
jgi:hypothetical protein